MADHIVVDAQGWLFEHIERLLEADTGAALPYLERLLVSSEDIRLRVFCLKNLGMLHLSEGDLDEARKYLQAAVELSPTDPQLHHALGQIAASNGKFWIALLQFMEAAYHAREEEAVDVMRSIASTMRQLEFGETALSVLLGAYERAPEAPWVLESLAGMYESEERWLDAIAARESLFEALDAQRGLESEEVRKQLQGLSDRMRRGMRLVDETYDSSGPSAVARTSSPAGLHTLVEALGLRSNNLTLLRTAEVLWARALYAKFDVHLSVSTLAAAIHWTVERLHWRVPTTLNELAALYNADAERLGPAVRLLVACLDLQLVPTRDSEPALSSEDRRRLEHLQRAMLYGVSLDEVEAKAMLGGDDD